MTIKNDHSNKIAKILKTQNIGPDCAANTSRTYYYTYKYNSIHNHIDMRTLKLSSLELNTTKTIAYNYNVRREVCTAPT